MNSNKPLNEKLKQTVLYVLCKTPNPENLGLKKLCKILYFADFNFYKNNHRSITGCEYLRWEHGPVPEHIYDVIEELRDENKLAISDKQINDEIVQRKFDVLEPGEYDYLSTEETAELDKVINKLGNKTGKELEELSHQDTPWQVSEPNKKIKYKLVFYRDDTISALVE